MGYIEDNPNYTWLWWTLPLYAVSSVSALLCIVLYASAAYILLKAKNRSMWWILPSVFLWFIIPLLENRSEKEMGKRNRVWELTDENMKLKEELRQHTNKSDDAWQDICEIQNMK